HTYVAQPERLRRRDVLPLSHAQHLRAHHARLARPTDEPERQEDGRGARAEYRHDDYQEEQARNSEEHVGDAHDEVVNPAAEEARDGPERDADDQRDALRDEAD